MGSLKKAVLEQNWAVSVLFRMYMMSEYEKKREEMKN